MTIPAGSNSCLMTVTATVDHLKERKETAIMTLRPGTGYKLPRRKTAKLTIVDSP